jgi:hypothetical protein
MQPGTSAATIEALTSWAIYGFRGCDSILMKAVVDALLDLVLLCH